MSIRVRCPHCDFSGDVAEVETHVIAEHTTVKYDRQWFFDQGGQVNLGNPEIKRDLLILGGMLRSQAEVAVGIKPPPTPPQTHGDEITVKLRPREHDCLKRYIARAYHRAMGETELLRGVANEGELDWFDKLLLPHGMVNFRETGSPLVDGAIHMAEERLAVIGEVQALAIKFGILKDEI